ncbi:MAG: ASKHA domain-containing protein [Candidatus Sumerlaeia bacterium]|nr:ASKHA domain-containing protein [Candidatus Sumerlaeia bacterium]
MIGQCEVCFAPDNRRMTVEIGTTVAEAAACADIGIEQPCGGHGRCGKCRVRFSDGVPAATLFDRRVFTPEQLAAGWRLACKAVLLQAATIEVPAPSLAVSVKTFGGEDLFPRDFERAVAAQTIALDADAMDDQVSLLERVARACGRTGIPKATTGTVRELARAAASRAGRIRVLWEEETLRAVLPADSFERPLGVAIDLGTTTVAAALIDLHDGATLAIHSALNGQARYGADVISRITYCAEHADGVAVLQKAVAQTLSECIAHLCRKAQVARQHIVALALAGNSTMQHLAVGVSPLSLGMAPYVGVWRGERSVPAAHLWLDVHPRARVWLTPMVRSNVGGDTTAAMVATGMDRDERLRLLIDIGTNAEVVLGSARRRIACSTSAGPAFEGAHISQGMRAGAGAIDYVAIHEDGSVAFHVIGSGATQEPARGICGSGLIDAVAELLRVGVIDERGWLRPPTGGGKPLPDSIARRIIKTDNGMNAFVLSPAEKSADGNPVCITAADVRQLQLVKGSIAAGIEILCREMGVEPAAIEEALIAGAFGNYIRKSSALAIGLVPVMDPERVRFVGDAAGIGARMVLVDRAARRRAVALADSTEYVELAGRADYQSAFAAAMMFHKKD